MSDQDTVVKVKKERTPAQLEHLKQAREKALVVRRANADLKKKEMEVDKAEIAQKKKARVEAVESAYKQLKGDALPKDVTPKDVDDDDEEIEYVYEPKKKKKKRVVVVQETDSEDEEEVQVVLPKPRRGQPKANHEMYSTEVPKLDPKKQAMYNKMFGL